MYFITSTRENNFIAASANINDMDEEAKKYPIVTNVEKDINLNAVMSNSFGFRRI